MQSRNSAISILRVMAMILIVFTHLCQLYDWVAIRALIFGVPLFLCISGYLYGQRNIVDWKQFFVGRVKKILLPIWIFSAFVMLYSTFVIKTEPSGLDILLQFLNLQGINNLLSFVYVFPFGDCAILWFMTIIMLCYFSVPIVQFIFNKTTSLVAVLLLLLLSLLLQFVGVNFLYLFIFWLGYYFARKEQKKPISLKMVVIVGGICFALWICRVFTKPLIDGTLLYNKIISVLALDILAFFVFVFTLYVYPRMTKIFDSVAQSCVFKWFDAISIYVYMVHYLFFKGCWAVTNITDNTLLQTFLIILFTIPVSMLLKIICEFLQKIIFHSNFKNKEA